MGHAVKGLAVAENTNRRLTMFSRKPVPATLYARAGGSNCLEYRVTIAAPFPADIAQRLLRSSYRWTWESRLLRDYNLSRSSLPQHRAFSELNAQSSNAFLADVSEIIDDEHRFIVLAGYRPDGSLNVHDELERFCSAQESRITYVVVHDGDTACLYIHFGGKLDDHEATFNELFGVALDDKSRLPERSYGKLGIITLENIYKLKSNPRRAP